MSLPKSYTDTTLSVYHGNIIIILCGQFTKLQMHDVEVLCHSETLPVEYLSGKPLCMDQYYQILSSCRIPGPKRDTVVNYAIGKTSPTHITVVHNFQVL